MHTIWLGDPDQAINLDLDKPEHFIQLRVYQPGREIFNESPGKGRVRTSAPSLGSISLPSYVFLQASLNVQHKIWITLFDFIEDDEYDGDLGEDDEEKPRI